MRIKPSVLSSFTASGFSKSLEILAAVDDVDEPVRTIELYAFMERDLVDLEPFRELIASRPDLESACVVRVLSAGYLEPEFAAKLAKCINERCVQHSPGFLISAISTFVPEISRTGSDSWVASDALKALRMIVAFARELRRLGHPAKVIELVGGSRVGRIGISETGRFEVSYERNTLYAIGIHGLLQRLESVCGDAVGLPGKGNDHPDGLIPLALELEPDPLFTLGTWGNVMELVAEIEAEDRYPAASRCLGLNLDIPHYAFLAKINRSALEGAHLVLARVAHAHISDHSVGHFADIELCTIREEREFGPYIDLVKSEAGKATRQIPFSQYISIELECCSTVMEVIRSHSKLARMLE